MRFRPTLQVDIDMKTKVSIKTMDEKLFWSIVITGTAIVAGWLAFSLWYSPNLPVSNNPPADTIKGEKLKVDSPVFLENLKDGDVLPSGFVLRGKAQESWFRDGSFPIFLADSKERIVAQTFANVKGGSADNGMVAFEGPVFFAQPETRRGTLFFVKMGSEGLPDDLSELEEVLRVGVRF